MKTIEDAVRRLGGAWPSNDVDAVYLCKLDDRYVAGLSGGTARYICTRYEFEQCARRLRNEPSFDDHPDAKCFVQNDEGYWYKNTKTNKLTPNSLSGWGPDGSCYEQKIALCFVQKGEVIGDWKDTLRLRPEEKKVDTTDTLLSSYRKALQKVLEDSECGVVPKSHLEAIEALLGTGQQGNKNDWYERGEFPPVGTVCRIKRAGKDFEEGTLMYLSEDILVWRYDTGDEVAFISSSCSFQPLQTERERTEELHYLGQMLTATAHDETDRVQAIIDRLAEWLDKMPEAK